MQSYYVEPKQKMVKFIVSLELGLEHFYDNWIGQLERKDYTM